MNIFAKIKQVYQRQQFVQSRESWSFYRFFVFFFSWRGQKRIMKFIGKVIRYLFRGVFGGKNEEELSYTRWRKKNLPDKKEIENFKKQIDQFNFKPLISIILPVYNVNIKFLKEAIQSVQNQLYENWEICIADDKSDNQEVLAFLNEVEKEEKIKVSYRKENGHISACSNTALAMAFGDYICLLDQDDLIAKDALYHFIAELNINPRLKLLYSDEDKVNDKGWNVQPHLKPDWSPDNFLSRNYIGHMVMIQRSLVKEVGGFREGFEGSQDYDLLLRITEKLDKKQIAHIPKILYHWRMHNDSTSSNEEAKSYAFETGIMALNDAFKRRNIKAKASLQENKPGFYHIDYQLNSEPKISIIIPTKNNSEVLSTCLESIFKLSSYVNFEVIVLNNNSDESSLFDLLKYWKKQEAQRFKTIDLTYPFNFSKLMNDGIREAEGEYILLLNNDTEVLHGSWLENMLKHAQRDTVGAVGAKLLYPNDTIQHAGVVIGMGEVAGHTFVAKPKDDPGYFYYLTSATNYSAVTAACLMVSRDKYNEVGGFDENLAVEYNDVDFCLKLIEAGYYNIYIPEVQLYHYESLTRGHPHASRKSYKQSRREIEYFKSKWQSYIDNDPFYNPNLSRLTTHFDLKEN